MAACTPNIKPNVPMSCFRSLSVQLAMLRTSYSDESINFPFKPIKRVRASWVVAFTCTSADHDYLGSILKGPDCKESLYSGVPLMSGSPSKSVTNMCSGTTQEKPKIYDPVFEAMLLDQSDPLMRQILERTYIASSADERESVARELGVYYARPSELSQVVTASCSATAANDFGSILKGPDPKFTASKEDILLVLRNGIPREISKYDLLPGDMFHLSDGDTVPANGEFVSGLSVLIDESSLTGESEPMVVTPENPLLLAGTKVLKGGWMMVTTRRMPIYQEILMGNRGNWQVLRNGLVQKRDDKALVHHLAGCGTMGSVTNIMCSDKTGTLPTIKMTVGKSCIWTNFKDVSNHSDASSLFSDHPEPAKFLLQALMDNTGGYVVVNKSGKNEMLGTPADTALLEFGSALGGDFQVEREAPTFVKVGCFNSTMKRLRAVLELLEPGGCRAYTKAASEIILVNSDMVINSNGGTVHLDEALVKHLEVTINDFAGDGLGTLCLDKGLSAEGAIPTSGYILIYYRSCSSCFKESVAICCSAGINGRATERTTGSCAPATHWFYF